MTPPTKYNHYIFQFQFTTREKRSKLKNKPQRQTPCETAWSEAPTLKAVGWNTDVTTDKEGYISESYIKNSVLAWLPHSSNFSKTSYVWAYFMYSCKILIWKVITSTLNKCFGIKIITFPCEILTICKTPQTVSYLNTTLQYCFTVPPPLHKGDYSLSRVMKLLRDRARTDPTSWFQH